MDFELVSRHYYTWYCAIYQDGILHNILRSTLSIFGIAQYCNVWYNTDTVEKVGLNETRHRLSVHKEGENWLKTLNIGINGYLKS